MLAFKPSDRHCIEDVEIISRCARNCSQFTDISKRNFDWIMISNYYSLIYDSDYYWLKIKINETIKYAYCLING